ncbi:MAG: hypothetical protein DMF06_14105 [Verrucomicrobia bacterium]|nr:MAG: hypothetical protein DMF06_14105 [Verrucomicrobiota bacterium]
MNTNHLKLTVLAAMAITLAACQTTTTSTTTPNRFETADVNHDKFLSLDEINVYLVTEIFDSRDANKDKKMTRAEWGATGDAGRDKQFKARDTNGDGIVTMDEALAYGRTKGMAKQVLREADTNKDGKLSEAEVKAYYASREGPAR